MSHELEQHPDGSTAFVAGHNQDAWHRLGTVLPAGLTAQDVMTYAHLGGWDVRKREIQTTLRGPDGVTSTAIDGKYVTVRTNPITSLEEVIGLATGHAGIVSDTYTPFQNESLVDYLQTMTDESGAFLDTAGSMRAGADVFITMKLPTTMLVGGVDHLDVNIAILNNHTGNRAITGLITPTRIVCANTRRAALHNAKSSFKIRHTANAGDRVQEACARVTVTRPVPAKPAQYSTPTKGKVLYAVTVTFVGVSGKVDANPLFFQARDAQGDTFDAGLANIDNELSSGSVTPGRRLRGRIAFEVLKGKRISLITFGVIDELAAWQFPG